MKRTFKLIKEYPNSPELGTIVSRCGFGCCYNNDEIELFDDDEEDFPEFWEEVKDKGQTELSEKDKILMDIKNIVKREFNDLIHCVNPSLDVRMKIEAYQLLSKILKEL